MSVLKTIQRIARHGALLVLGVNATALAVQPKSGPWRAWLDSPGGELPFGLELQREAGVWKGWVINGEERIAVPKVTVTGADIVLDIDYYDAKLLAALVDDGAHMDGQWKKRGRKDAWVGLPFHAVAGASPRFSAETGVDPNQRESLAERWEVKFSKETEPVIAVLKRNANGTVTGTLLTTTGDYGHLAGVFEGGRLRLSNFDGAHAFLLDARLQSDGTFKGDFWSRDSFHDTWTAREAPNASLPDAFELTRPAATVAYSSLVFDDLDGNERSVADVARQAKVVVLEVFGSWCPNCNDASALLVELDRKYRGQGVAVVGLAFELTGNKARDAKQLETYIAHHNIGYPVLLAGVADNDEASKLLPMIDRLRAFPTTVFMDRAGRVRAVHTGFSGPATGEEYRKLRSKFEAVIGAMLADD